MTENDPLQTQRDIPGGADLDLITELHAAGFDDEPTSHWLRVLEAG